MYMLAPLLGLHSSLSPAHCHLPRRLPHRLHDNCSSDALHPTHLSPPSPPSFLAHTSVSFASSTAMEALQICALVFVLILYFLSQQMPGTGQVLNFDGVNWWDDYFLSATPLPLLPLHICWLYLLLNYFWSVTFPRCLFIALLRMRKPAPLNSLHFPSFLSWFWLLTASIDHSTTQNVSPFCDTDDAPAVISPVTWSAAWDCGLAWDSPLQARCTPGTFTLHLLPLHGDCLLWKPPRAQVPLISILTLVITFIYSTM